MRKNRKEQKASTREHLIATAHRLFSENTYQQVSIRRIASEAGMTTGAVYLHFGTKAQVWSAVMGTAPPLDSALTRQASDIEKSLRQLVRLYKAKGATPDAWERGWNEASQALQRLDGEAEAIGDNPVIPKPPAGATDDFKPLEGPARMQLILDVLDAADRTNWRPVSFGVTAETLTEACQLIAQRETGAASDLEVYKGAVQGAACMLVVAARGITSAEEGRDELS